MQLSIFDELDAQLFADKEYQDRIEAARQEQIRAERDQPKQCSHCGDWSANEYLWEVNHGTPSFYDMPGVCVKHWALFNQARWDWGDDARAWLTDHGFEVPSITQKWVK